MKYDNLRDGEIYREMTIAQDKIIAEIYKSNIITLNLSNNEYYNLTAGANRKNIRSIKAIYNNSNIEFVPLTHDQYANLLNSNTEVSGNVRYYTISNNRLYIHPKENNGIVLKLIVYQNAGGGVIDANNEPEVPEIFDKAIELYATSQFIDEGRANYLSEFLGEIKQYANIINEEPQLIIKPIEGWY